MGAARGLDGMQELVLMSLVKPARPPALTQSLNCLLATDSEAASPKQKAACVPSLK